jgi:hypothetical protein
MNTELNEHVLFQPRTYFGENLKEKLGLERCPRVQSGAHVFAAFEPMASLSTRMLIAGTLDSECRMLQWDLLASGQIQTEKFCAAHALAGVLEHKTKRLFLVHNEPDSNFEVPEDFLWATRSIFEACCFMGYELADHIAISKKRYRSVLSSPSYDEYCHTTMQSRVRSIALRPRRKSIAGSCDCLRCPAG